MFEFRPSSLKEREEFYKREFDLDKTLSFIKWKVQLFAVDYGSETGITTDKEMLDKIINLKPLFLKEKILQILPEDVYYDRNKYKDVDKILKSLYFKNVFNDNNFLGQQLAFDVDPENIKCECNSKGIDFCFKCLKEAIRAGFELGDELKEEFKDVKVVYSGRGCHVHVFDETAFRLTIKEREEYNKRFMKYHIDPWVSRGEIRLMRLPYSLNGLVSRKVIPIKENFDPLSDEAVPGFLKKD